MSRTLVLVVAALVAVGTPAVFGTIAAGGTPDPVPEVATGFTIRPFTPIPDLPTAVTFGPGDGDGPDLYVAQLTGVVTRFALTWTDAGPLVDGSSAFASGFGTPLGLAFGPDGALYVSDSHDGPSPSHPEGRITRIAGATQSVVVDGVPQGQHNINNMRFAPDGRLVFPNGNPNDHGTGTGTGHADVFPITGAILALDPADVVGSPAVFQWQDGNGDDIAIADLVGHSVNADFFDKVDVLATGFRNIYDVAFAPADLRYGGSLYTAMNGADGSDFDAADEASQDLLYKVTLGADHGYPFCYNVGPAGGTGGDVRVQNSPDEPGHDCSAVPAATALLGWHVCATGLDFPSSGDWQFPEAYHSSVFVGECAFFGASSWTQNQVMGPGSPHHSTSHKVVRVALDAETGEALGVHDFVTGLVIPTDVHFGPDGAMYIADAAMIYRVAPLLPPSV